MSLFNPYKETRLDISLTSVGAALMITGLILALACGQLALHGLPADAVALKRSPSEVRRDGTIVPREQIHTEVFRRAFGYARVAHLGGGIMLFGAALMAIGHGGRLYRLAALGASTVCLGLTLPATVKLSTLAVRYSEPPPLIIQSPVEDFTDANGAEMRMEPTPDWGAVIRSAGPDGRFETDDDVILGRKSFLRPRAASTNAPPARAQGLIRVLPESAVP